MIVEKREYLKTQFSSHLRENITTMELSVSYNSLTATVICIIGYLL
jgi:hypothetical protein